MIVLDTAVLVYAVGTAHEYRGPCRELLTGAACGAVKATTTLSVIQEFAHVRARRRGRDDAATHAEAYMDLLAPLLSVEDDDVRQGLETFRTVESVGCFDAILAAVAMGAKATLVSTDKGYASVPGLPVVVPDQQGVRRLLE